jgi:hypothetical protein
MTTPSVKLSVFSVEISRNIFSIANRVKNKLVMMAIFILIFILTGCNIQNKNQLLIEKLLFSDIEVGTIIKLNSLGIDPAKAVCVLQPYQADVHGDYPEKQRINKYLQQKNYKPSEGSWALIMMTEVSIELLRFGRSKKADFSGLGMKNWLSHQLPDGFEVAECVSYEQAALFKTQTEGRVYFVFGRIK